MRRENGFHRLYASQSYGERDTKSVQNLFDSLAHKSQTRQVRTLKEVT